MLHKRSITTRQRQKEEEEVPKEPKEQPCTWPEKQIAHLKENPYKAQLVI